MRNSFVSTKARFRISDSICNLILCYKSKLKLLSWQNPTQIANFFLGHLFGNQVSFFTKFFCISNFQKFTYTKLESIVQWCPESKWGFRHQILMHSMHNLLKGVDCMVGRVSTFNLETAQCTQIVGTRWVILHELFKLLSLNVTKTIGQYVNDM